MDSSKTRVTNWSNDVDRLLVDLLAEQRVRRDGFTNGTFTKQAWRTVLEKFNQVYQAGYTLANLKNRFKNLKRLYSLYRDLKNRSGWGWDDTKHLPTPGTDDAWDVLVASKKEYNQIRGKPFLIWEQMNLICSGNMANGHLASSSLASQDNHPPSQIGQQDDDDDHDEIDLDINMSGIGPEDDAPNSITQQTNDVNEATSKDTPGASTSSRKRKRNPQFNAEAFDRLLELGEERLKLTKELVENQRRTIPPQVDVALQELLKVEGIPQHYIYKAINLLKDKDDRCIFLALPNEMRLGWILSRLE